MKLLILCLIPFTAFAGLNIDEQFKVSVNRVIINSTMPDVYPGMVVASPSRSNPDYYYDWVRDTALTMSSLVDYYAMTKDSKVKEMLFTWVEAEKFRQNLPTFSGLGEPKYNINGTPFNEPWGRPQNDGPALRATAMIKLARILISEGNIDFVLKNLYHGVIPANSVIKKDLEYTAHHWREPSFDLWEEEKGMHFYTMLSQQVALQEGAKLARELRDYGAADFYEKTSHDLTSEIYTFFDDNVGIRVSKNYTAALGYKNSGIDVAPLLALIHNYPYQSIIGLDHPNVKKYIQVLKDTFFHKYPINKKYPVGIAIGRYPEDKYDGYTTSGSGEAWFLATLALGEFYCLQGYGDFKSQFERVLFHSDGKGRMDEQFNQNHGYMQGAYELTWSHNAFMTAYMKCFK